MRATRAVCAVYAGVCFAVLLLIAGGTLGWLGLARGWASPVAHVLGMPWSLLVAQMADPGLIGRMVLGAAAMTLNLAIIFHVGRWLARQRA